MMVAAPLPLPLSLKPRPRDPVADVFALYLSAADEAGAKAPTVNYADDPIAFARDVVGALPWEKQQEILRALVPARARVSVRSGHKVSKSHTAALAGLWFYSSFEDARVILTAPTARQVQAILWREVRKLHARSKQPIPGDMHERAHSGLKSADFREVVGYTAKDPEAMAGTSGANILYIVDEASGVSEAIFEAIEGNRAAGARLLLLGNPTRTAGEFFLSHTKKRAFYTAIHVSSEDTPNCTGRGEAIPGLASPEWVKEKLSEWGEDSPLYQVRVRGNFPSADPYAVVGVALLTDGEERGKELAALDADPAYETDLALELYDGPLEFGVDPARFGDDDTAVAPRRGRRIFPLRLVHGMDTVQIAGLVLEAVREMARAGERGVRIKVDVIGIGAGVVDQLVHSPLAADGLIVVVPINSASASSAPAEYPNLRSQLLFDVAAWLKGGGALPPDDKLAQELTEPRYSIDGRGRRVVEPKDEVKKRIGRSPDRADAVALAVYEVVQAVDAPAPPPVRTFNFDEQGVGL